ncbi:MAG TPA: S41 family peptidase [Terriglobales bacterium]
MSRVARFLALVLTVSFLCMPLFGDQLSENRTTFKLILKAVSHEIEKNYYDPQMRGIDWSAATAEANERIEKAQNVTDMARAIWILTNKLKDSHTGFVPPGRAITFQFGFDAKPIGNEVRVYKIRKGGEAEKAGLKVGDRLLKVNTFSANRASFDDMMFFFRVIANMSVMEIVYQRDNEQPQTIRLQGKQKTEAAILDTERFIDSLWELIRESQRDEYKWHSANYDGIGYAQLRSFDEEEDFLLKVIRNSDPSKGLVIDLRDNGGGAEDTLKSVAGHFVSSPTVMFKLQLRKGPEDVVIKPRAPRIEVPVVILVDSETGSAAEMFARFMQLQNHAVVVGDHSSGRVMRSRVSFEQVGAGSVIPYLLSITTARVVMADGQALENVGVKPDVECIPLGKDMREEEDACLGKALSLVRKAAGMPEPAKEPAKEEKAGGGI